MNIKDEKIDVWAWIMELVSQTTAKVLGGQPVLTKIFIYTYVYDFWQGQRPCLERPKTVCVAQNNFQKRFLKELITNVIILTQTFPKIAV